MKDFKYEELKEIRRGFGIIFVLVLTYLGDLLKGYVKNPNPSEKETVLILLTGIILLIILLGVVISTLIIGKKETV
ncbi:hypothetical protein, partial [Hydrogenivirga sp. 128-5-R1-1]|uniref:hypothetical protein n=1 Tax=Hydrogenivirga sp. 128-5-R1-1 TaxID=392423 RepID=UPI00015F1D6E